MGDFSFRSLIKPGEGSTMILKRVLEAKRDEQQMAGRFGRSRYQGVEDLLATHGTYFTGRDLPEEYQHLRGELNRCHHNSVTVAKDNPELRYFTGVYMVGSRYQTHSWLVAPDGGVVEVTLEDMPAMRERYPEESIRGATFATPGDPGSAMPWAPPDTWAYCGVEYTAEFADRHGELRGLPIIDPLCDLLPGETPIYLPDEEISPFKHQYSPEGFPFTEPDPEALAEYMALRSPRRGDDDWDGTGDDDWPDEEPEFA